MATAKISFREKFCYGLGDTSFNIFMGVTMMFLTVFYTDVFKLNPAAMGTLFLVTRIIDAISDPLCGMISDRVKSRFGRYRSWLLYFSVPYGISCAAVFFSPDLSETGRIILRLRHVHLLGFVLHLRVRALRLAVRRHYR